MSRPGCLWRMLCVVLSAWCIAPLAHAAGCQGAQHVCLTPPALASYREGAFKGVAFESHRKAAVGMPDRLLGFGKTPLQALPPVEMAQAVMGASGAIEAHEDGERQLIERYVAQRNRHLFWQGAAAVAVVLILVLILVLHRYRRMLQRLARSNEQILRQQHALEAANRELERLSQTDGLTGLANRRQFDHALLREHARQRRTGSSLSLLMIDLDHFKHVNDHYGHAVGDDYLRAVARVLQVSVTRATDLAARYGGEEYVCLLPDTSAADAFMLAERIRRGVADLCLPNAHADGAQLTVSVGVATLEGGTSSAAQLLVRADEQLYAAKRDGRDRVHAVVLRQ